MVADGLPHHEADQEELMITADTRVADDAAPALIWVGESGWVACDTAVPENDPRRVIAYLECKNRRVEVLWVRDRHGVSGYETLAEAMHAVAETAREGSPRARQLASGRVNSDRVARTVKDICDVVNRGGGEPDYCPTGRCRAGRRLHRESPLER